MSRDIDKIPHLIIKLTDGIEFHDIVVPARCWAWSKVAGLFMGPLDTGHCVWSGLLSPFLLAGAAETPWFGICFSSCDF